VSAPHSRNILRISGRLIKDPTSLSAASPYGGAELGISRDMEMRFGRQHVEIIAEEFRTPVAVPIVAERPIMGCVLRSYDSDMLQAVFQNQAAGSVTGDRVVNGRVSGSGINRAGYDLMNKAFKLLFAPKDEKAHPFVILYNAVPMVDESAALQLSLGEEFGMAIMFLGAADTQGRTYSIGKLEDLSL